MNHISVGRIGRPLVTFILLGTFFSQCKTDAKKDVPAATIINQTNILAPQGFSVEIIAKDLGALRHMTVSKNGDVYVNRSKLQEGKGIVALKDSNGDGVIDDRKQFADVPGTGILFHEDYLYAFSKSGGYRYKLDENE